MVSNFLHPGWPLFANDDQPGCPVVFGGRRSDGNFGIGKLNRNNRSFTLERDKKSKWGDTLPAGMNNGPMKHVPYSKKIPASRRFCFFAKKRGFLQVETTWKPMVSGCPCFNPTFHAFALLRAIHCKVLCASLSLGLIGWLNRVPFMAWKTQVVFLPGIKHERNPVVFFSGKIFWESWWRKTLQLKFELWEVLRWFGCRLLWSSLFISHRIHGTDIFTYIQLFV